MKLVEKCVRVPHHLYETTNFQGVYVKGFNSYTTFLNCGY